MPLFVGEVLPAHLCDCSPNVGLHRDRLIDDAVTLLLKLRQSRLVLGDSLGRLLLTNEEVYLLLVLFTVLS